MNEECEHKWQNLEKDPFLKMANGDCYEIDINQGKESTAFGCTLCGKLMASVRFVSYEWF